VKFYSGDVPSQELNKFRADLEQTGFGFGLMVSLTSRLTGISGALHLEETPKYLAIYTPNAGVDGHRLLCAVAMLKAVILYQARTDAARLVPAGAVEQAWTRLNSELQEFIGVTGELHALKNSLRAAQQNLATVFGKATERVLSAEVRLRYAVNRITNRLAEELGTLSKTSGFIGSIAPAGPDAILTFLHRLQDESDPRLAAFRAIYDLSNRLGLQVGLNDDQWQLLRGGCVVASTGGTKTRLDAIVPINPEESVRLRPLLEKLKDNGVVIDGTNVERMMARLEDRLGSDDLATA
jgi:hypothetical protein